MLDRALALQGRGPYVVQAAIAALHAEEPRDWRADRRALRRARAAHGLGGRRAEPRGRGRGGGGPRGRPRARRRARARRLPLLPFDARRPAAPARAGRGGAQRVRAGARAHGRRSRAAIPRTTAGGSPVAQWRCGRAHGSSGTADPRRRLRRRLRRASSRKHRRDDRQPENFMLYTPLLPEAASGTLEPRHVVVPLRVMCPHAELLLGRVTALDEDGAVVHVETEAGPSTIAYEQLVVALGAVTRTLPRAGARRARDCSSSRSRTRSGCATTCCGGSSSPSPDDRRAPADVRLRRRGLRRRRSARRALRSRPRRAPLLPDARRSEAALGARRCSAEDPRRDPAAPRRVRGARARAVAASRSTPDDARIGRRARSRALGRHAHSDGNARLDGRREGEPAARRARAAARRAGSRASSTTRCACEGHEAAVVARRLRARAERATPGAFDPPTCQHALRQARRLAKNLRGDVRPYRYRMLGQVATLGRYKGIADVLGLRLRGFPGWFVTRSLSPVPTATPDAQASRRDGLDGRARLPPGRRRARRCLAPARPCTRGSSDTRTRARRRIPRTASRSARRVLALATTSTSTHARLHRLLARPRLRARARTDALRSTPGDRQTHVMGLKELFQRWSKGEDARAVERAEEESRDDAVRTRRRPRGLRGAEGRPSRGA